MSETIPAQSSPPLIAAPTEPQVNFRLKTFKLYKLRKNRNQKKNLNNERFEGPTEHISTCHEEDEVRKNSSQYMNENVFSVIENWRLAFQ